MKKLLLSLSAVAVVFAMASCGDNPKSAGEKVGKKYCECKKLSGKEADRCKLEREMMDNEYKAKFVEKKSDFRKYEEVRDEYRYRKCD